MSAEVAVVGSVVQDLAFKVQEFAAPGETRIGSFFMGPGGKGSNQAVACHRQGIETRFIGAVGEDLFGAGYKEWAAREGLPTSLLTVSHQPTGAASICINQRAENSIVVALGANDALSPEHVVAGLAAEPTLKVCVVQAESNLEATKAALKYCRQRGVFSIFNPAPINPEVTPELLALSDCLTPNETEFAFLVEKFLAKKVSHEVTTLSDADLRILVEDLPVSLMIITVGSKGSIVFQRGDSHSSVRGVPAGEIVRVPALEVTPVDTTGAGDAFNGGLAAGLIAFKGELLRAVRFATVVAGLSTQSEGTAPAMPSREMVASHAEFFS